MLRTTHAAPRAASPLMGVLLFGLVVFFGFIPPAQGVEVRRDLQTPGAAMAINGQLVPEAAVSQLLESIRAQRPEATRADVLRGLVVNRLVAQEAESELPGDRLTRARENARLEMQQHLSSLAGDQAGNAVSQVRFTENLSDKQLKGLLRPSTPGSKLGIFAWDRERLEKARDRVILQYRDALDREREVRLSAIAETANVQDLAELQDSGLRHLHKLAREVARQDGLKAVVIASGAFTDSELDALEQLVLDKHLKEALMQHLGVYTQVHHSSPALNAAADQVGDKAIETYYKEHRDHFRQVATVRARHIRLGSQQEADHVYHQLMDGRITFEEAVARHSLAEDRNAAEPGSLGLIRRDAENLGFVEKLALIPREGAVSKPFRVPGENRLYWEIIKVDQRGDETLPVTDPGVRQQIAREIAREQIRERYDDLRRRLLDEAVIRLPESGPRLNFH